jgi:hypothetical protein
MSYQAYLDNIEEKTGITPRQFIALAQERGLTAPDVKAGQIIGWLREDYGLGHGHAAALANVIRNGDKIGSKHVGTGGTHSDASDTLWLDGKATRPR